MIQLIKQGKNKMMGIRGYKTKGDVRRAITQLSKHGHNYFVVFQHGGSFKGPAVQYGTADWVPAGMIHVDW